MSDGLGETRIKDRGREQTDREAEHQNVEHEKSSRRGTSALIDGRIVGSA
jgi:hypothetical protein